MEAFSDSEQLLFGNGYNNGFVLNNTNKMSSPAAQLYSSIYGRKMELYTDAPSCVLYSGGYIGENHILKKEVISTDHCGIALEAQDYPNAPNHSGFSYSILKKDMLYERTIQFCFS